ncbi:MAG: PEGA domain-containing protein [Actinobacteria bacterium]|nr:PEGA domain-containing protein [Actinomycetota bacterium]
MRKVFLVAFPPIVSIVIFVTGLFILNRNPGKGALQVTASPSASVYLNNKLLGNTPLCKCDQENMLDVGEYTIRIVPKEGNFQPFEQKIKITKSVLTVVDRTFSQGSYSQGSIITLSSLENKKESQLSILSFPDKSDVYLDNELVGLSPSLLKNVTVSDHEIKLKKNGYKDKTVRIKTVAGYKLEALVFLGVNPDIGTTSASQIPVVSLTPAPLVSKVTILDTPTGFLRVRESNSVSSSQIGTVNPGEQYDLVSEEADWVQIKLSDGKAGWVSSQYIKKE